MLFQIIPHETDACDGWAPKEVSLEMRSYTFGFIELWGNDFVPEVTYFYAGKMQRSDH